MFIRAVIQWILAGLCLPMSMALALPLEVTALSEEEATATTNASGPLEWRAGFILSSKDPRFGGISSIQITADGKSLWAIGDRGTWMRFSLEHSRGILRNVSLEHIGLLSMLANEQRKDFTVDAESSDFLDHKTLLVGFERINRLLAYKFTNHGIAGFPKLYKGPPGLKTAPRLGGPESLAKLCDGRLFILTEKGEFEGGARIGWLGTEKRWTAFGYRPRKGYHPTGVTVLPDCRLMLTERRFRFAHYSWRIALLNPANLRPDSVITGRRVALFQHPAVTDNFEAIAARRGSNGETLVYVMSDDNFSIFQQTYLLQFALKASDQNPLTRQ
ncbi:MAG TPA: hypothetical protein DCS82_05525 [Rhodospirillaceae bacterium]|nr:hypothetical protein [Rhodospirillaceae bacterium]HAT35155.1 hypothetical protein [Rhodospirillaceae bacterium]